VAQLGIVVYALLQVFSVVNFCRSFVLFVLADVCWPVWFYVGKQTVFTSDHAPKLDSALPIVGVSVYMWGTYQVETNSSVQTMKTSIRIT
jgi:hypothetical protein